MAEGDELPDPRDSVQIFICGKKKSGKTELAFHLFDGYPFDRICIDPNGDIKMPPDTLELTSPLPTRWPGEAYETAFGKKRRQTLHFVPEVHLDGYKEEMDRAVALAYAHGNSALFFDECQVGAPANQTPPHMRRALWQGRHSPMTLILASPRPMTIDPLCISQADYVYAFKLQNPADRKRVAENIGWDPKDFDDAMAELKAYEFLRYEAGAEEGSGELVHFPALPPHLIRHHQAA